ncbi:MAG: amidohydrolase family protein [Candidatus Dormibacteria bacterium]
MIELDFHTHVFPQSTLEGRARLVESDAWFGALYADARRRLTTVDDLLEDMTAGGVGRSVALSFPHRDPGLLTEANASLAAASINSQGRVAGFGMVDPASRTLEADVARIAALGLSGIGEINADAQGFDLEGPELPGLAGLAAEAGLPLLIHASEPAGHDYPGKGTATPDRLWRFLERAPVNLTLVLAHLGGGLAFYAHMPEVRRRLDRVYFDTAALPFLYDAAAVRAAGDAAGFDRILFGSDYPLLAPGRVAAMVLESLPDEHVGAVLGGTGLALIEGRQYNP